MTTSRDDAWVEHAACSKPVTVAIPMVGVVACGQWDPNLWFVDKGSNRAARSVCAQCPVWLDCLDYAIGTRQEFGCWGGAGEHTRRKLTRLLAGEGRARFLVEAQDCMDRLREFAATGVQPAGPLNTNGPGARHGRAATYARGCRCAECRAAIRESQQRNRPMPGDAGSPAGGDAA